MLFLKITGRRPYAVHDMVHEPPASGHFCTPEEGNGAGGVGTPWKPANMTNKLFFLGFTYPHINSGFKKIEKAHGRTILTLVS